MFFIIPILYIHFCISPHLCMEFTAYCFLINIYETQTFIHPIEANYHSHTQTVSFILFHIFCASLYSKIDHILLETSLEKPHSLFTALPISSMKLRKLLSPATTFSAVPVFRSLYIKIKINTEEKLSTTVFSLLRYLFYRYRHFSSRKAACFNIPVKNICTSNSASLCSDHWTTFSYANVCISKFAVRYAKTSYGSFQLCNTSCYKHRC